MSPLKTPPKAGVSSTLVSATVRARCSVRGTETHTAWPDRVTGESRRAAEAPLQHPALPTSPCTPGKLRRRGAEEGDRLRRRGVHPWRGSKTA